MKNTIRGERVKLSEAGIGPHFSVTFQVEGIPSNRLVFCCLGLDSDSKLYDGAYFVSSETRNVSPCGAISVIDGGFTVDLSKLPSNVRRLAFSAAVNGSENIGMIRNGRIDINGGTGISYSFQGSDFSGEKAFIAAEIYLKDEWRFAAAGTGVKGDGIDALASHFDWTKPLERRQNNASSANNSRSGSSSDVSRDERPNPPNPEKKVSLKKVKEFVKAEKKKIALGTILLIAAAAIMLIGGGAYVVNKVLEKSGESVVVEFDNTKPIHVNLNWESNKGEKVDLDLGCFIELSGGFKDVIQPLGENFGSKDIPPYVFLDKDDRSGEAVDGENMYFTHVDQIKRAMIFALIYDGADSFKEIKNGVLVLKQGDKLSITVPLNNLDNQGKALCSVAKIETEGKGVRITKEERYFKDQSECDSYYGYEFSWKNGSKD